jgi:hypothetical protein
LWWPTFRESRFSRADDDIDGVVGENRINTFFAAGLAGESDNALLFFVAHLGVSGSE